MFQAWVAFSQATPILSIGRLIQQATVSRLPKDVVAAYNAPFPSERYKAAARAFPLLVPSSPDGPASGANRQAWAALQRFDKPFLTAFSDGDPITRGNERRFQTDVPGAQGQPHCTIADAGHFLQEDKGPELACVVVQWLAGLG